MGHSLNFLSRGTDCSAEQRAQLGGEGGTGIVDNRYRNDCSVGEKGGSSAELCSLDMISTVASAYWVRWMLVSAHQDADTLYIARGAPRRWFKQINQPFEIERAPTRFG
jgi:hypothetical protein